VEDPRVNEVRLFHGSGWDILQKIKHNGHDHRYSNLNGRLGGGSYFTDMPAKAIAYTPCPICRTTGDCVHTVPDRGPGAVLGLLVNRVILGK
jgi:hypothetical protein